MARKSEWLVRIPEALDLLTAFPAPVIDRAGLERVLGIQRRVAIRLMHQFGGYQAGRTFLIDRSTLISGLREVYTSGAFHYERRRWLRVSRELEEARKTYKARQIPIPAPDDHFQSRIVLERGRLEIRFETAIELLQSLVELAKAVSDDFEAIRGRIDVKQDFVPILPESAPTLD
jgi:hypothetical protein